MCQWIYTSLGLCVRIKSSYHFFCSCKGYLDFDICSLFWETRFCFGMELGWETSADLWARDAECPSRNAFTARFTSRYWQYTVVQASASHAPCAPYDVPVTWSQAPIWTDSQPMPMTCFCHGDPCCAIPVMIAVRMQMIAQLISLPAKNFRDIRQNPLSFADARSKVWSTDEHALSPCNVL